MQEPTKGELSRNLFTLQVLYEVEIKRRREAERKSTYYQGLYKGYKGAYIKEKKNA